MTRLDLQPFFRSTIGFDEIVDMLGGMTDNSRKPNQYPPYNIEKMGEEIYRITIAVAGFQDDDLDITKHNHLLSIEGRMTRKAEPEDEEHVYLYKGIAERSFQLQFRLADHMNILGVDLENGMLCITMEREVPEALKPQKLKINTKKKEKRTLIEGNLEK